ncbi:MAG: VanZ family protein [Candidatus Hatepunaea meridiana]|nr:VanZ family protein [Candidatus Hatepunaea meridiana]
MKKKNPRSKAMIQYILFTTLVVMTPFIVVTRFLQGTVHDVSHMGFFIFGHEIPYVASAAVLGLIVFLIWQRKNITLRRIGGGFVIVGMIAISQKVQDLYGGMSVYDLQRNWHYVAYSAYVFFFFRAFNLRNLPQHKAIVYSFTSAFLLSIFDEFFQLFFSNRVFDLCDQAKDCWGCIMGLILILFVSETYGTIKIRGQRIWKKRFKDYFKDPLSAFVMVGLFALVFILISPLLTDHSQIITLVIFTLVAYAVVFVVVHFTQFKPFRIAFISLFAICVLLLTVSFVKNKDGYITHYSYHQVLSVPVGLVIYKGLPVPFFDLMIYPDGFPRLVDKKHFFNNVDKKFFLDHEPSILLVGTGWEGQGGKGFTKEEGTYFTFNNFSIKGTQIIILKTSEACKLYNRLRSEGKNVLFVIHNTC